MWYNQNPCIMTVFSIIFLMAIVFIALAALLTSLKANGRIDGESPSKNRGNSSSCEYDYDESDQSSGMFEGLYDRDLAKDMYGNPIYPERYKRAKRREAKLFGDTYYKYLCDK